MKKIFLILVLFSSIWAKQISLNDKEKAWIKEHPVVKVTNELNWPPYDYNENGIPKGVSVDVLKTAMQRLGIKIEFISGEWQPLLEGFKNKEIDIMHPVVRTKERDKYTLFTRPHIYQNNVIIVKKNKNSFKKLKDLEGKRLAVSKGYASHELIRKNYPKINFVEVSGTKEGLTAVSIGEADAYIDVKEVSEYLIKKHFMSNLKMSFDFDFQKEQTTMSYSMGIRDDWPILHKLLEKALNDLTAKEISHIYAKYGISFTELEPNIKLSDDEERWLEQHDEKIKICVDPNWMPIEGIDENGLHVGMTSDFMDLFSKRIGHPVELKATKNWNESVEMLKSKECDLIPEMAETSTRKEYFNFTEPYLYLSLAIATDHNQLYISSLRDITSEKLAMIEGYSYEELIKKDYPNLNFTTVQSISEGLQKIQKGELFGLIEVPETLAYEMQRSYMSDLKISPLKEYSLGVSMAVHKDSTQLLSTAQKFVDSLDEEIINKIRSQWMSVRYQLGEDNSFVWKLLSVAIVLILVFIYWNRRLANEIEMRKSTQKELEIQILKANELSETKSIFLAKMSHEIRTPINAVIGMLYLVQSTELSPSQLSYVSKSKAAADSLLHIINDLLDLTKIEAGKLEVNPIEFDFYDMLNRVTNIANIYTEDKDLELIARHDSQMPRLMISDPSRIEQILLNLLNNAIKFTSKGGVLITSRVAHRNGEEITIEFCVEDSGIGISQEDKSKLFQDFSQLDESTSRKFGGTGLGLSISKKLCNLLGGDLELRSSTPEVGSVFCFTFVAKAAQSLEKISNVFPNDLKGLHVLLVDDNQLACEVLSEMLESFHITSESVHNGEDALRVVFDEGRKYDMIFLDYKLPGLNGLQVYRLLKDKLKENVPKLVMMSAYSKKEILESLDNEGVKDMLQKPIHPSFLYDIIVDSYSGNIHLEPKELTKIHTVSLESVKGSKILLVEDNPNNQLFASVLLESNGMIVDVADDGVEALSMIKSKEYDIVLMDIQMPNMDGLEAASAIRAMDDDYFKTVPIIALSAHAMTGDVEKSKNVGMNEHINKPIDPDNLFETMVKFIKPKERTMETAPKQEPVESVNLFYDKHSDVIDFQKAIARAGGNQQVYLKILKRTAIDNANFFTHFKELIYNGELVEAEKKIHDFKGINGNIGAAKLFDYANQIDDLLKKEVTPSEEELNKLNAYLEEVITEIDKLEFEPESIDKKAFNEVRVLELLDTIEKDFVTDVMKAIDAYDELKTYAHEEKYVHLVAKIGEDIDNFDMDSLRKRIVEFKIKT